MNVRKQSTGGTRSATHDARRRLDRILALYVDHCSRVRTAARVSEIAQLVRTNRSYLSRTASPLLGRTLRAALAEKQLAIAERLLRQTNRPIAEVAVLAAFGTPSTFHRVFRKAFGCTPGEYRRRVTKCE